MQEFANKRGVTVVLLTHKNKKLDQVGVGRILGSSAWSDGSRLVFTFEEIVKNSGYFAMNWEKGNLDRRPEPLVYKINTRRLDDSLITRDNSPEPITAGIIEWVGVGDEYVEEVLQRAKTEAREERGVKTKGMMAEDFLKMYLSGGAGLPDDIIRSAKATHGIGECAIRKAKARMGLISEKDASGKLVWGLPRA